MQSMQHTKEYFEDIKEDQKNEIKLAMLEARLVAGNLFKKVVESVKDLIRWDYCRAGCERMLIVELSRIHPPQLTVVTSLFPSAKLDSLSFLLQIKSQQSGTKISKYV